MYKSTMSWPLTSTVTRQLPLYTSPPVSLLFLISCVNMSVLLLTLIGCATVALVGSSYPYSDYSNDAAYSFSYDVLDPYSGQDFGHMEARKQDAVNGEYHVLLPDDRIQVVRYTADHNGYVADVQYSDGSSSPAYGKAAAGYGGGYSGGASVKTSSYFNPGTSGASSGYYHGGGGGGGSMSNAYGGYSNYQTGQSGMAGSYPLGEQAFKSGCVCQCPA